MSDERRHNLLNRLACSPILFSLRSTTIAADNFTILPSRRPLKTSSTIDPNDLRDFYYKDSLINLHVDISFDERLKLLDALYFRMSETDNNGEKETFQQLAAFHFGTLCPKLKEVGSEVEDKKLQPWHPRYENPTPKDNFSMRETFGKVFIVLDRLNWQQEGVVVICRDDKLSKEFEQLGGKELADERFEDVTAYRAKLENVMKAIVAEDPARAKSSEEYVELYDRWCGDGHNPSAGPPHQLVHQWFSRSY